MSNVDHAESFRRVSEEYARRRMAELLARELVSRELADSLLADTIVNGRPDVNLEVRIMMVEALWTKKSDSFRGLALAATRDYPAMKKLVEELVIINKVWLFLTEGLPNAGPGNV